MAHFIELTESEHARKILLNLEEVTFLHPEKKEGKTTIIHLTSSTYGADRSIGVTEDYDIVKAFVVKAKLFVTEHS